MRKPGLPRSHSTTGAHALKAADSHSGGAYIAAFAICAVRRERVADLAEEFSELPRALGLHFLL